MLNILQFICYWERVLSFSLCFSLSPSFNKNVHGVVSVIPVKFVEKIKWKFMSIVTNMTRMRFFYFIIKFLEYIIKFSILFVCECECAMRLDRSQWKCFTNSWTFYLRTKHTMGIDVDKNSHLFKSSYFWISMGFFVILFNQTTLNDVKL